MYALLTIIFLVVSATSNGDHQIGMAIVAGLFGIADSLAYRNYKTNKNNDKM